MLEGLHGVLLVSGGRHFVNADLLQSVLDRVAAQMVITCVRHGQCHLGGADLLADEWARSRMIPTDPMPADWDTFGLDAGFLRNSEMLAKNPKPVALVAFPGGPGTRNMVKQARIAGLPALII